MTPLLDTTKMSADEFKFIRLYCSAVRRDYYAVDTAISLTDPRELGLTCPFTITKLAIGLQGMYREYAHKFADLGVKHFPDKLPTDCTPMLVPSMDDIGSIFTLSFFKLVDSATKSSIVTSTNKAPHDGWSSGRPSDWKHSLKSLYEIQKQKPANVSVWSEAFHKLFGIFMSNSVVEQEDDYDEDDEYYNTDDYYFF